ncbi:MAG: hypothetical protein BRC22_00995, partial [Parcubacteria group bacterium QH_9_35_7]
KARFSPNDLDEAKVLIWEQNTDFISQEDEAEKFLPEYEDYKGPVAKVRRIKGDNGYMSTEFYLNNEDESHSLKKKMILSF